MEATDRHRAFAKPGPLWPQGKTLDDIRRHPSLFSTDGSIRFTTGPSGTDCRTTRPMPVAVTFDADTAVYTVYVGFVVYVGGYSQAQLYQALTFEAPAAAATIDLAYSRFYRVSALHLYGSVVYEVTDGSLTPTGSTGNAEVPSLVFTNAQTVTTRIATVVLPTAALYATSGVTVTYPNETAGTFVNPRPYDAITNGGIIGPLVRYQLSNKTIICEWWSAAGTVTLAVPVSTHDDVYAYGDVGHNISALKIGAPGAGDWGFVLAHVQTDGDGKLVDFVMASQAFWWQSFDVLENSGQGLTTTQVVDTGSGTVTLTITNGLITGIA